MEKIWKTTRYLARSVMGLTVIGFLSILGNLVITNMIFYFMRKGGELDRQLSNQTEVTAGIFILLISLLFFSNQFKVMLGNGVSRKSFFWANITTLAAISAAFALFVTLVTLAHLPFEPMTLLSQSLYIRSSLFDVSIFQLTAYFLLAILGWFIHLAYYRSGTAMRWVISLAPFFLLWILISEMGRSGVFWDLLTALMGFSDSTTPNPFIGSLSILALASLLSGVVYLLIRRAPLKD
jgi:hypothetical protein